MATLGILCRIPWRNRIYFYFCPGPSEPFLQGAISPPPLKNGQNRTKPSPSKGHGWVVLVPPPDFQTFLRPYLPSQLLTLATIFDCLYLVLGTKWHANLCQWGQIICEVKINSLFLKLYSLIKLQIFLEIFEIQEFKYDFRYDFKKA